MLNHQLLRQVARATSAQASRASTRAARPAPSSFRQFTCSLPRVNKGPSGSNHDAASTSGEPYESGDHEGQNARTRENIQVKYPEEKDLSPSRPVQGRGGSHFKRTLATFSMEGRVAVVTGGARGLGLVMAQALVTSGADVALVDMNKEEAQKSAQGLTDLYKTENPESEE